MASRISKNVFAQLFPALQESPTGENLGGQPMGFIDPNTYGEPRLPYVGSNGPDPIQTPGYEKNRIPNDPPTRSGGKYDVPFDDQQSQQPSAPTQPEPRRLDVAKVYDPQAPTGEPTEPVNYGQGRVFDPAGQPEQSVDSQIATIRANNPKAATTAAGAQTVEPESAYERAKRRVDELTARKVENRDKGVKGALWEALSNALAGIAETYKANPRGSWQEMVAGAGAGVGRGAFDRTWNEQRRHDYQLGRAQQEFELAHGNEKRDSDLQTEAAQRIIANRNSLTQQQKLMYDQLSDQQKQILDVYKEADEFDPSDANPAVQEIVAKAKALGVTLLPKRKGERFNFQVTPDGKLVIGNTATGQYNIGQGNFARPAAITANELPDNLFGLQSEKELDDAATAAIGQEFPNRRRKPEIENSLKNMTSTDENGNVTYPYRNPDGSFNEAKALEDGVADVNSLYENQPSNYQQRLASTRKQLRDGQKWKAEAVQRFRSVATNARPGAKPVPLDTMISDFKSLLSIKDAKERRKKLDQYFKEILPNIRPQ